MLERRGTNYCKSYGLWHRGGGGGGAQEKTEFNGKVIHTFMIKDSASLVGIKTKDLTKDEQPTLLKPIAVFLAGVGKRFLVVLDTRC